MNKGDTTSVTGTEKGTLFVVSAPSGAGKTTLCRKAIEYFDGISFSVSYTTRSSRKAEIDGIDYHFIDEGMFQDMINRGEFLEWAEVHHKLYGTSRKDVTALIDRGYDVIMDIDVQGARQVKKRLPGAVYIFILPPSLEACEERLRKRGKDSNTDIAMRVNVAKSEIKDLELYDFIIINDNLASAFETLKSIIIAKRSERKRMFGKVKRLFPDIFTGDLY